MEKRITLIPGDGIGPDIIKQAVRILDRIGAKFSHSFIYTTVLAGGAALDEFGEPLPAATMDACLKSDAVLLGAVGGPKWDALPGSKRPEQALLGLRKGLGVYANLRPVNVFSQLIDASPLKKEIIGDGFDFLIVRELTGGIYFGKSGRDEDNNAAFDTEYYSRHEIDRVLRVGFKAAMERDKRICIVDKANILESSRLWREVAGDVSKDFVDIMVTYMYVDNCAMQIIRNPAQFDVIVTSNLFGDILSDEASMISGSIGMLASASIGDGTRGLYEPIHGSAPDIAGKDIANPLATILSAAMMLRYSFHMTDEAEAIEMAVREALDAGYRTSDIAGIGCKMIGTYEMGTVVAEFI